MCTLVVLWFPRPYAAPLTTHHTPFHLPAPPTRPHSACCAQPNFPLSVHVHPPCCPLAPPTNLGKRAVLDHPVSFLALVFPCTHVFMRRQGGAPSFLRPATGPSYDGGAERAGRAGGQRRGRDSWLCTARPAACLHAGLVAHGLVAQGQRERVLEVTYLQPAVLCAGGQHADDCGCLLALCTPGMVRRPGFRLQDPACISPAYEARSGETQLGGPLGSTVSHVPLCPMCHSVTCATRGAGSSWASGAELGT